MRTLGTIFFLALIVAFWLAFYPIDTTSATTRNASVVRSCDPAVEKCSSDSSGPDPISNEARTIGTIIIGGFCVAVLISGELNKRRRKNSRESLLDKL